MKYLGENCKIGTSEPMKLLNVFLLKSYLQKIVTTLERHIVENLLSTFPGEVTHLCQKLCILFMHYIREIINYADF